MTRWAPDIDDVFVWIDFWDWMTTGDVLRNPEELDWTAMQKIFLAFQKFNNILLPLLRHILQATQQQRASCHPRHLPDQRGPPGESHCVENWTIKQWKTIIKHINFDLTEYTPTWTQSYLLNLWLNWTLFYHRLIHRQVYVAPSFWLFLSSSIFLASFSNLLIALIDFSSH